MIWLIAFAVLAGAYTVGGVAVYFLTRPYTRREALTVHSQMMDAQQERMKSVLNAEEGPTLILPHDLIFTLRDFAADSGTMRDFWLDYGQEIETLARQATEAARQTQAN